MNTESIKAIFSKATGFRFANCERPRLREWEEFFGMKNTTDAANIVTYLESKLDEARKWIQNVADIRPDEPGRYLGDNHGDSETSGYELAEWSYSKRATAFLNKEPNLWNTNN